MAKGISLSTCFQSVLTIFNLIRPKTKEELFNLWHSQLCNVIEHIFGVLKKEFKLVQEPCHYKIETQCHIPLALRILHNFYYTHNPHRHNDQLYIPLEGEINYVAEPHGDTEPHQHRADIEQSESLNAQSQRDNIAEAMWQQYQEELER